MLTSADVQTRPSPLGQVTPGPGLSLLRTARKHAAGSHDLQIFVSCTVPLKARFLFSARLSTALPPIGRCSFPPLVMISQSDAE